jgi:hypothetical protein
MRFNRTIVRGIKSSATIVLLISLCFVARGQVEPSSPPKSTDQATTGTISGKVVNEDGQPLAGAALFVRPINVASTGRTSSTDSEGSFRINNLDAGLYTIMANSPAYTLLPLDPDLPPTYYRIGDSVRLELVRGGVITGTVTNAAGQPLIAVRVRASMVRDAKGKIPRSASFSILEQTTDDRGIYRIYGLAPGTYLVSAGGSGAMQSFQLNAYDSDVPTYAPSSTRDNASEITVRSGEDNTVDIRYRGEPGFTISGTVKTSGTNGSQVTLAPAGGTVMPVGGSFQPPGSRGFAFSGIGDGEYDLVAQEVTTAPSSMAPLLSSSETKRVTVKGASVSGIELVPRPLASISGRISLEPSKAPECQGKRPILLAETLVHFRRHEKDTEKEDSITLRLMASSASPDKNGDFVLRNLLPGRYHFDPRFYARYWYLQSIHRSTAAANTASKSQPVTSRTDAAANWTVVKVGDQLTNLTITLAEGAASVRGRIAASDPPAGMSLYLLPSEQDKAEDVLRFFVTDVAADGTFALTNLPPGKYLALLRPADSQTATLAKLRLPEAAAARTKLRRTAEGQKTEIELKPCQNLADYQMK